MDLLFFIRGYYELELICHDIKRFFNICAYHQVNLFHVLVKDGEVDEKLVTCIVNKNDLTHLEEISKKTSTNISKIQIKGLPYWIQKIKLFKWFFIGACGALFLLLYCSSLLWDIEIIGSHYYSSEKIIRYLKEERVYCGMGINEISTLDLADKIRQAFPDVVWCTASIDGCNLLIHIKENEMESINDQSITNRSYCHIISDKSGIIYDMVIRQGISDKKIGDTIKSGDILISGNVPIRNDLDEIVSYEYVDADGDIYLLHQYHYYDEINRNQCHNVVVNTNVVPIIHIFGYRFVLGVEKNDFSNLSVTSYMHNLKFTNYWHLPITLGKETYNMITVSKNFLSENMVKQQLEDKFYQFCTDLEKKGVQIYENDVKIDISDYYGIISGSVSVIEKVGISHTQNMEE